MNIPTLLAQAAAGTADSGLIMWGAILFGAAIVLVVVELFIPSGGLIGLLSGAAAIGSLVAFFQYDISWGIGAALTYLILIPIGILFFLKVWIHTSIGSRMILGGSDGAEESDGSTAFQSEQDRRTRIQSHQDLVGAMGTVETDLRPVGIVRIDNHRLDALSEQGFIKAGARIVVTDAYDNQLKVRMAADEEPAETDTES